jgi:squalene-hopene/tetraprenyl-beta-curcumene cyclase
MRWTSWRFEGEAAMPSFDLDRLRRAYLTARGALLAERTPEGHWVGELSTSALSTAVAVSALSLVGRAGKPDLPLIDGGLRWLAGRQNSDGGWGDTVKSLSNISTTMLCRSAFHLCGAADRFAEPLSRSERWLAAHHGKTPEELAEAVRRRYGKDRTFSVPILMTSALAGLVSWKEAPPLPFELACFPQSWFRFLRLPVVSYALPALIAIGQAVFHHRPPLWPMRLLRKRAINRSLRVLSAIQPSNGGFLEATPLTAFVALGLASTGRADHPVARKCVEFITRSVRPDGSWPIDTNLSTWVTTLAVNALAAAGDLEGLDRKEALVEWLLRQQYRERHPYTGADPGAWAWTPLPGGVPDADDTPGAMLALIHLGAGGRREPLGRALGWLCKLQNRNGGWPTFCRGWGKLPFDRSGCDLTAHSLRAIVALMKHDLIHAPADGVALVPGGPNREGEAPAEPDARLPGGHAFPSGLTLGSAGASPSQGGASPSRSNRTPLPGAGRREQRFPNPWWEGSDSVSEQVYHGKEYLREQQRPDGSWLPLWFGNQHAPDDGNPTYGTAKVLAAYRDLEEMPCEPAQRGLSWLVANQNDDGGWGGCKGAPSSIEETALAVEVLLGGGEGERESAHRGLLWLIERVEAGGLSEATPIGFYFAKLWYFEKLYPIVFAVAALGRACRIHQTG